VWWAGNKATDIYLGTRAIAVSDASTPVVVTEVDGFDAALGALSRWLNAVPVRRRLRVWLSGGLCRPFLLPAVQGVVSARETQTVAAALAPQHTGLPGPCAVFIEHALPLAVAVQESRVRQIHDLVATAAGRHQLLSIRPWWAEVLRYALAREPALTALGVQDCDSMTLLMGRERGGFDSAATYSPVVDQRTAQSVLTRALLSAEAAENAEIVGRLAWRDAPDDRRHDGLALGSLAELSR
jgi:hypothetical protein